MSEEPSQSTHEAITRLATMLGWSLETGWDIDDCRISMLIDEARKQVPIKCDALSRLAAARAVIPMLEASPSELRLLSGEMTAQEMRTVRAVTGVIATKLKQALSDTE